MFALSFFAGLGSFIRASFYWLLPLCSLTCACLGQYFAYPRGYLRQGFISGFFAGPLGLLLVFLLLPQKEHPLLEVESQLHYSTDDPGSRRFLNGIGLGLISLCFLGLLGPPTFDVLLGAQSRSSAALSTGPATAPLFDGQAVSSLLVMVGIGLALSWSLLHFKAQPPLVWLRPLREHARHGMDELLHWVWLRWAYAWLLLRAGLGYLLLLITVGLAAGGLLLGILALCVARREGLLTGALWLAAFAASFYAAWRVGKHNEALQRQRQLMEAETLYELHQGLELQRDFMLDGLQSKGRATVYSRLLEDKVVEIMRRSGGWQPSRERTRPIAAATLDAETSAKRLMLRKTLLTAGGGYLAFKAISLLFHSGRLIELTIEAIKDVQQNLRSGSPEIWSYVAIVAAALVGLIACIVWLARSAKARRSRAT